jgi:hypothetical protein
MRNVALVFVVPLLLVQAACGSDQELPPLTTGASVLRSNVTQATLRSLGGGYGPGTPAGAPCDPGQSSYTVVLATSTLTYGRCRVVGDVNTAASYMPESGQLSLSPAQMAMVRTALEAVKVSNRRTCGADKGVVELEVDTPTQNLTYGDDFYGCEPNYQAFVDTDGLDHLYTVLSALPS